MLVQKKTINNVPQIIHLTADTGTGAPVGSLISMYKKSSPSGYLYCDGSTFDQTAYPALYQYLGSNVLPDYRECVAVGAEQNTTDTIANHDVYTEGQFKDDQIQDHTHFIPTVEGSGGSSGFVYTNSGGGSDNYLTRDVVSTSARAGTTTHGKQKAVFIYIKATSGLTENQQENVLNTINENLSYSTTEHKTGKKWIDGKDIYQKVVDCGGMPNATLKTISNVLSNIDYVISIQGSASNGSVILPLPYPTTDSNNSDSIQVYIADNKTSLNFICKSDLSAYLGYVTLEYTKTTDN